MTTALAVTEKYILRTTMERTGGAIHLKVGVRSPDYGPPVPPGLSIANLLALAPVVEQAHEQARQEIRRRGYTCPVRSIPALPVPGEAMAYYRQFGRPQTWDRLTTENVKAVSISLEGLARACRALGLINIHFPDALQGVNLNMFRGWWDMFVFFYRLIEDDKSGDWFPINRPLIDHLWNNWSRYGEDPFYLTRYLTEIPLEVFGIGVQEEADFPVLSILYELLSGRRLRPEIYDSGTGEMVNDIQAAHPELFGRGPVLYDRVRQYAPDMQRLKPPLDCLPGAAEVVMAKQGEGNPFLSTWFDMVTLIPSQVFYWDRDVPRLKNAWGEARPAAEQFTAFKRWFTSDCYDHYWGVIPEDGKVQLTINTLLSLPGG